MNSESSLIEHFAKMKMHIKDQSAPLLFGVAAEYDVNFEDLNPILKTVMFEQAVIETIGSLTEDLIIVTSGKDGGHSTHSVHYIGDAIDLRIRNIRKSKGSDRWTTRWWYELEYECQNLADKLGPQFVVLLEKSHIHIQVSFQNMLGHSSRGKYNNFFIKRR